MSRSKTSALDDKSFAALLAPFAPFEAEPEIAVAVSGGADSMALALLLSDWARACGGKALAFIVDHGLRGDSAEEAALVRERLEDAGIPAEVITWTGPKPEANRQAAARAARYRLLAEICAERGILHLALAHHREDQAETLLLRLGRGSGLDGLAGMPPQRELPEVRLLRPLLDVPRESLRATLRERGLAWIEDPSNQDTAYSRVRLRKLAPDLAAEGMTPERLAKTAGHLGRARAAMEAEVAALLARAVQLHPAGFAWVEPSDLAAAPAEIGHRALARLLMLLGGSEFPPRWDRLTRLFERLGDPSFRGATQAGCRIALRRGRFLIVREPAAAASQPVLAGDRLHWDGRFDVALSAAGQDPGLTLGPLGAAGWRDISGRVPKPAAARIPPLARPALPALWIQESPLCVPHLGYRRAGTDRASIESCRFAPKVTLTPNAFADGFRVA